MSSRTYTQEDPIGLAGGLNLYGFAGGDPINFSDPFGLCPLCVLAYGIFEVGASLYDVADLAITGVRYLQGTASAQALGVTAAGVGAGFVGLGGGYGRAARALVKEGASDIRLWKKLASDELLGEAQGGRGVVIAGAGHGRRQIDDVGRLVDQYGGNADDWAKMTTRAGVADDGTSMSVHWYENVRTGHRVEFKTKIEN